ncbi:MAG: hypothetical protein ACRCYN_11965, partial [Plesiomonas sp.]
IRQILRAQASRSARLAVADDIIDNDYHASELDSLSLQIANPCSLATQVALLHQTYLSLAAQTHNHS